MGTHRPIRLEASAIMTGSPPSYILDANVSTITTRGNAKKIEAIIGLRTDSQNWGRLLADISRNATGNTTYAVIPLGPGDMPMLTMIPGLMRAIPWEHIDPPDPDIGEWLEDLWSCLLYTSPSPRDRG